MQRSTPPPAVRAIGLSVASFVAFATFAATPGSPFQPVLPDGAQSTGPFRWLADLLHLGELAGNWLIGVGVAVSIFAVVGFLMLLREAFHGRVTPRAALILGLGYLLAVTTLPLLFSRDVYSYAFYGRISAIYQANPYVRTPVEFSGDALWVFVGPKWVDTPAVYGPLWTTISSVVARSFSSVSEQVAAYRMIAAAAGTATLLVIAATARRLWPSRTAFAVVAFGANPVVLFHSVASGHNDLLVALSVASAFALLVRRHGLPAVAVLALGALIKATVVIPLALVVVWLIVRRRPGDRARYALKAIGLAAVIASAFALPYLSSDDPTLGMAALAGHEGWLAPASFARRALDMISFGTLGGLAKYVFAAVLVVSLVVVGRMTAREASDDDPRTAGAAMGWSLVLLMLLGPLLLPWYVTWALPLAWLLPQAPRATAIGSGAALVMAQWTTEPLRYPAAFDVNLWIGQWVMTPLMLALVVWALFDLRGRYRGGFALEDQGSVPESPGEHGREGGTPPAVQRDSQPLRHEG